MTKHDYSKACNYDKMKVIMTTGFDDWNFPRNQVKSLFGEILPQESSWFRCDEGVPQWSKLVETIKG